MKTLFRWFAVIVTVLLCCGVSRGQEPDLMKLDPKKATPAQWERLVNFLDHRAQTSPGKTTGDMREIRSLIMHGNKS